MLRAILVTLLIVTLSDGRSMEKNHRYPRSTCSTCTPETSEGLAAQWNTPADYGYNNQITPFSYPFYPRSFPESYPQPYYPPFRGERHPTGDEIANTNLLMYRGDLDEPSPKVSVPPARLADPRTDPHLQAIVTRAILLAQREAQEAFYKSKSQRYTRNLGDDNGMQEEKFYFRVPEVTNYQAPEYPVDQTLRPRNYDIRNDEYYLGESGEFYDVPQGIAVDHRLGNSPVGMRDPFTIYGGISRQWGTPWGAGEGFQGKKEPSAPFHQMLQGRAPSKKGKKSHLRDENSVEAPPCGDDAPEASKTTPSP
ncbi:uncharacterized protein [Fopius arisanus]|uniref:Uncharacterized protein n=1 Tax=Fopius arisanus TaxID=64838 RepID=A0A9R1U6A7_9HYME|nr:PREDICTED: uncharacterized protein LOC105270035 [Fopius arisanus]